MKKLFLIIGAPGSGKTTDAELIAEQNDEITHYSTGDMLRAEVATKSELGQEIDKFIAENPPPVPLKYEWFGLNYINIIWQQKIVSGMLQAFIGSFLVVFLMMTILFRSALWGLLSMIPLTITIGVIYGAVGLVGRIAADCLFIKKSANRQMLAAVAVEWHVT